MPTLEELEDYERQYLLPLRNQLEQIKKTGTILSEMSRTGVGKRGLDQILAVTSERVNNLFTKVEEAKEHLGDASTAITGRVNDIRRLESLIENVSVLVSSSTSYCPLDTLKIM